ncbi:hypothetical protein PIB30_068896 [Stylosanthes scabra]|uniref:Uncharacterized protein n=1 Tax=Stylosanthes scabra TaxID=79078 RepID=A0ABU6SN72_9FABA|nr:hypothetical protein [Stylosanthes scabra]
MSDFAAALAVPSHRRCSLSSPEFIRLPKTIPYPSLDPNSSPLPLLSRFAEILSCWSYG